MGIPLKEILGRLPEDEQREIEARARELIAEEIRRRERRTAMPDVVLNYKGYSATYGFDVSAGSYHGHVVGISDTVDFWGRDEEELAREFHASIDEYIEWLR